MKALVIMLVLTGCVTAPPRKEFNERNLVDVLIREGVIEP